MSNQNQPGPRPTLTADLTPEAAAVVEAAHDLIGYLQRGDKSGVFGRVLDLQRVLADLETIERQRYNQRQMQAIERAAGLALTHKWELVDSGIRCVRCPIDAGSTALKHGTVPECNANTRCAPFAARHFIVAEHCVYCRTVYPATAGTREAVTR